MWSHRYGLLQSMLPSSTTGRLPHQTNLPMSQICVSNLNYIFGTKDELMCFMLYTSLYHRLFSWFFIWQFPMFCISTLFFFFFCSSNFLSLIATPFLCFFVFCFFVLTPIVLALCPLILLLFFSPSTCHQGHSFSWFFCFFVRNSIFFLHS